MKRIDKKTNRQRFIIIDWAGNVCFQALGDFPTHEDAEEALSAQLVDNYETDREEYEIAQA